VQLEVLVGLLEPHWVHTDQLVVLLHFVYCLHLDGTWVDVAQVFHVLSQKLDVQRSKSLVVVLDEFDVYGHQVFERLAVFVQTVNVVDHHSHNFNLLVNQTLDFVVFRERVKYVDQHFQKEGHLAFLVAFVR